MERGEFHTSLQEQKNPTKEEEYFPYTLYLNSFRLRTVDFEQTTCI